MRDDTIAIGLPGTIRRLDRHEMPLLREHLVRLDTESRHDRFNGFADESFIERYAAKCATDGTIVIAYLEDGEVLAAAELHPADGDNSPLPEVAFSVEREVRRMLDAVGHPVRRLIRRRFGPVELGELPSGKWRVISPTELRGLLGPGGGS